MPLTQIDTLIFNVRLSIVFVNDVETDNMFMSLKVGTWNGANKQRSTFDSQGDTEAPISPGEGRMYTITSILVRRY